MLFGAAGAVLYSAVFLPPPSDLPALYFEGCFFILSEKFFDIFKNNDSEQ